MQNDILNRVFEWNKNRGLLNKEYSKTLEASFISEELSELLRSDNKVDIIDSHIDSIIFQFGALAKLLKSTQAIEDCFNAVLLANEQKGKKCDENGKIIKNKDTFIEPQEVIKKVLERIENEIKD